MGQLKRELIPDALAYCDRVGLPLIPPRGKWRSTRCDLCGASKAMRINTESNGWCCMACLAHGGSMLDLHMQLTGLDFVAAARDLGAYIDDDQLHRGSTKPRSISAPDSLELLYQDALLIWVAGQNIAYGVVLTAADLADITAATRRVLWISQEART